MKEMKYVDWRRLPRTTLGMFAILGYTNVFGRGVEGMTVSEASAAWLELMGTLPRRASCKLPALPTVEDMCDMFRRRKSVNFFIGTYVLGIEDEAAVAALFEVRQQGQKYTMRDNDAVLAMLKEHYDLDDMAKLIIPTRLSCYQEKKGGKRKRQQPKQPKHPQPQHLQQPQPQQVPRTDTGEAAVALMSLTTLQLTLHTKANTTTADTSSSNVSLNLTLGSSAA